jgi:YD repeat-containing protein
MKTLSSGGLGFCTGGLHPGQTCLTNNDCIPNGTCTLLGSQVTSYDYAGTGRVVRRANANGTQTTYAYDDARRVTRTTHVKLVPYTEIDDRVYAWDLMDNKTSRTELQSFGGSTVHEYSYDSAGQMTEASRSAPGTPPVTTSYTLDGVGNRLEVVGGTDPGPYSMSSALPEPADHQVNQYTSTPFYGALSYDRNGSLVTKSGTGETLSYDYHGQLMSVAGPLGAATFAYDPLGRRINADAKPGFNDGGREIEQRDAAGS